MTHATAPALVASRSCLRISSAAAQVACVLAGMACVTAANALDAAASSPSSRFSVESLAMPAANLVTAPDPHALSLRDAGAGLHARWSVGTGAVGVGASAEWAGRANASALRPMWGVHADLAPSTRLTYEVRSGTAAVADRGLLNDPTAQTRWTLEVKPSQSPLRQWQSGLLRLQMSSTSTLALKPRGGGMTVSWQSRF